MRKLASKSAQQSILAPLFVAISLLTCSVSYAQEVGAYIASNGGCTVFGKSWEIEFQRKDGIRYGKEYKDWNERDYQDLKSWILQCLDPWSAAPGRGEVVMRNAEERLRSFDQTRNREQAAAAIKRQQAEEWQQIVNIDNLYSNQAQIARAASLKFDNEAANYLATFKTGVRLSDLQAYELEATRIKTLLTEASKALSEARSIADTLRQKGGPLRYTDGPAQATAFEARIARNRKLKTAMETCLPKLEQAGLPRDFASTPILSGSGADDPFFFEVICPTQSDQLQFITPGLLSAHYKLNIGRVVMTCSPICPRL